MHTQQQTVVRDAVAAQELGVRGNLVAQRLCDVLRQAQLLVDVVVFQHCVGLMTPVGSGGASQPLAVTLAYTELLAAVTAVCPHATLQRLPVALHPAALQVVALVQRGAARLQDITHDAEPEGAPVHGQRVEPVEPRDESVRVRRHVVAVSMQHREQDIRFVGRQRLDDKHLQHQGQ